MTKAEMLNRLYQVEISMRATLVLNYLINRANAEMTCFPAIKTIARDCNMSTRTVQRAINDLLEAGLVEKNSRYRDNGGQSSNLYILCMECSHSLAEGNSGIKERGKYSDGKKGDCDGEIVVKIREIGFCDLDEMRENSTILRRYFLYRKENLRAQRIGLSQIKGKLCKRISCYCHREGDSKAPP